MFGRSRRVPPCIAEFALESLPDSTAIDTKSLTENSSRRRARARVHVRAPEIAIEILSPGSSNERRDRHGKLNLYSARAVTEYWIVDPESRSIEIYRSHSGRVDLITTLHDRDVLTSPELPGFSARVDSLFPKL